VRSAKPCTARDSRYAVETVWARVHKIDRVKPQPDGSAIVVVEDERNAAAMTRIPGLSTVIAVARVLNAKRVLESKFGGKGEVRYATAASMPSHLIDAIVRAGGIVTDSTAERVRVPASPGALSSVIDSAMNELAHYVRTNVSASTIKEALDKVEANRRKAPLDREQNPAAYWTAVFELAALAGELSRPQGGMWIETKEVPVPFAIRVASGKIAMPAKAAMRIVEGVSFPEESMTDTPPT
jgi:hypothetical protein